MQDPMVLIKTMLAYQVSSSVPLPLYWWSSSTDQVATCIQWCWVRLSATTPNILRVFMPSLSPFKFRS